MHFSFWLRVTRTRVNNASHRIFHVSKQALRVSCFWAWWIVEARIGEGTIRSAEGAMSFCENRFAIVHHKRISFILAQIRHCSGKNSRPRIFLIDRRLQKAGVGKLGERLTPSEGEPDAADSYSAFLLAFSLARARRNPKRCDIVSWEDFGVGCLRILLHGMRI